MMKICCLSDTHGCHNQLDLSVCTYDVLIHAGDFTGGRDLGLSETKDFLSWFSKQHGDHKILICGNHERQVEALGFTKMHSLCESYGITYLQDTSVTIDGIKFHGSPYSNEFCDWAFMEDELQLSDRWDAIPNDINVLITHGPAYGGSQDLVKRAYGGDPHVGSQSLTNRKLELLGTLKLHISGHIHEGYGMTIHNTHTDICASILNEKYELTNKPTVVTLRD